MDSSFNRGSDSFEDSDVSYLLNGENTVRKEVSANKESVDIRSGKNIGIIGWTLEHITDNSIYTENESNTTMSNFSGNSTDPVVDFIDLTYNQEGNKSNLGNDLKRLNFPHRVDKGIQGEISGSKKSVTGNSIIRLILPPISKDCYEKNLENGKLYLKPSKVDLINVRVDNDLSTAQKVNSAHLATECTALSLNDKVKLKNNTLPHKHGESLDSLKKVTLQTSNESLGTSFNSSSTKQTSNKYSFNNSTSSSSSSSNNEDDLFDHPEPSNFASDRISNSLFESSNVSLIENNFEFDGDGMSQSVLNDDTLVSHEVEVVDEGVGYGVDDHYNSLPLVKNTNFERGNNVSSLTCATPLTFPSEALHGIGSEEFMTNTNEDKLNQKCFSTNKETTLRSFIEKDVLDLIKSDNEEEVFTYSLQENSDQQQPIVRNFSQSHDAAFSQRCINYDPSNHLNDVINSTQNVNISNPQTSEEIKSICPDNSENCKANKVNGNHSLPTSNKPLIPNDKNEEEDEIPIRKPTGLSMPIIDLGEDSSVEDLSINEKVICPKDLILKNTKKSQNIKSEKFSKVSGVSIDCNQGSLRTSYLKSRRYSEKYEGKIVSVNSSSHKMKNEANSTPSTTTNLRIIDLREEDNAISNTASPKLVTAENSTLPHEYTIKSGKQKNVERLDEICETLNCTFGNYVSPKNYTSLAISKDKEVKEITTDSKDITVDENSSKNLKKIHVPLLSQEMPSKSMQEEGNICIHSLSQVVSHHKTSDNEDDCKKSKENHEKLVEHLSSHSCEKEATLTIKAAPHETTNDSFPNKAATSQPRVRTDLVESMNQENWHEKLKSDTISTLQTPPKKVRSKEQVKLHIVTSITKESSIVETGDGEVELSDSLTLRTKRPKIPTAELSRRASPTKKANSFENLSEMLNFEEPGIHYMLPQSQRLEILNRFPDYSHYNSVAGNSPLNKKKFKNMTPNILGENYPESKNLGNKLNERNIKVRRHSMQPSLERSTHKNIKEEMHLAENSSSDSCFKSQQVHKDTAHSPKQDCTSFVQLVINKPVQIYNVSESGKSINEIAKKLVQKQELFAASKEHSELMHQKNENYQKNLEVNEVSGKEKGSLSELEPEEVEKKYFDKLKQNIKVLKRNPVAATKNDMSFNTMPDNNLIISDCSKSSKSSKCPVETSHISNEFESNTLAKNDIDQESDSALETVEDCHHSVNIKTDINVGKHSKDKIRQNETVPNIRHPQCKNLESVVNMLKDQIKENEGIKNSEDEGTQLLNKNEAYEQNRDTLKHHSKTRLPEVQSSSLKLNSDLDNITSEEVGSKTNEITDKIQSDEVANLQNGYFPETFSTPVLNNNVRDSCPLSIMCSISCDRIEENLLKALRKKKTDSERKFIEKGKLNHVDDTNIIYKSKTEFCSKVTSTFSSSELKESFVDPEDKYEKEQIAFKEKEDMYKDTVVKDNSMPLDISSDNLKNLEGEMLAINVVGLEVECGNSSSGSCFGSPTGKQESPEVKGGRRKKGIPKRVVENVSSSFTNLDECDKDGRHRIKKENMEKVKSGQEDDLKGIQDDNKANITKLPEDIDSNSKVTKNANILLKKIPIRKGRKRKKGRKRLKSESLPIKSPSKQKLIELKDEPGQKVFSKTIESSNKNNNDNDSLRVLEKTDKNDALMLVRSQSLSENDNLNHQVHHKEAIEPSSQSDETPYVQEVTVETSDYNDGDNRSLENIEMPILQAETYVDIESVGSPGPESSKHDKSMMENEDNKVELSMPPILTKEGSKSPPHIKHDEVSTKLDETTNMDNRIKTSTRKECIREDPAEIKPRRSSLEPNKTEIKSNYNGTLTIKTKTHLTGKVVAKSSNFIKNKGVILGKCINPDISSAAQKQNIIIEEKSYQDNKPRTNGIHTKVYKSQKSQEENIKLLRARETVSSENFRDHSNENNRVNHIMKPVCSDKPGEVSQKNENMRHLKDEEQIFKEFQIKHGPLTPEDLPKKILIPDLETIGTTENTAALHGIISELEETLSKLKDKSNNVKENQNLEQNHSKLDGKLNKFENTFHNGEKTISNALNEGKLNDVMIKHEMNTSSSDNLKVSEAIIISNSLLNIENLCKTISEENAETDLKSNNTELSIGNSLKDPFVKCEGNKSSKLEKPKISEKNLLKDDKGEKVEVANSINNSVNINHSMDNALNNGNCVKIPNKEIITKKKRLLLGIPLSNGTSSFQETFSASPIKSVDNGQNNSNSIFSQKISSSGILNTKDNKLLTSNIPAEFHEKEIKFVNQEIKELSSTNSLTLTINKTYPLPHSNVGKDNSIKNENKIEVDNKVIDDQASETFPILFKELNLKHVKETKEAHSDVSHDDGNFRRKTKTRIEVTEPKDQLINMTKDIQLKSNTTFNLNKSNDPSPRSKNALKKMTTKSKLVKINDSIITFEKKLNNDKVNKKIDRNIETQKTLKKRVNKKAAVKGIAQKNKVSSPETNISVNGKTKSKLTTCGDISDSRSNAKQNLDLKESSTWLRCFEGKNAMLHIDKKNKKCAISKKKLSKAKNVTISTEEILPIKSYDHKVTSPRKASKLAKNSLKGDIINKSKECIPSLNADNNNSIHLKPDFESAKKCALPLQDNLDVLNKKINLRSEKNKVSSKINCKLNRNDIQTQKKKSKGISKKGKKITLPADYITHALNDSPEQIISVKSPVKKNYNSIKNPKKITNPNNRNTDKYILRDLNHVKLKELINGAKKILNKKNYLIEHAEKRIRNAKNRMKQNIYLEILEAEMDERTTVADTAARITADERITAEALLNLSRIVEINEQRYQSDEIQTNLELLPNELRNIVGSAFIENSEINGLDHVNAKSLKAITNSNSFLTANTNFTFCRNHLYKPTFLNLTLFRKNNLVMSDSLYKVASLVLYFLDKKMAIENDYESVASTSRDICEWNPSKYQNHNFTEKNLSQVTSLDMVNFSDRNLNNATTSHDKEKHKKRIVFSIEQFKFLTDLIKMISCAPLKLKVDTLVNKINREQARNEFYLIEGNKTKRNGYQRRLTSLNQDCKFEENKANPEEHVSINQSAISSYHLNSCRKENDILSYSAQQFFGKNALVAVSNCNRSQRSVIRKCKSLLDINPNLRFINSLSNINVKDFFQLDFSLELREMTFTSFQFRDVQLNCRELCVKKQNLNVVEDPLIIKCISLKPRDNRNEFLEQNDEHSFVNHSNRFFAHTSREIVTLKSPLKQKSYKSVVKIDGMYLKRAILEMKNSDLINFSKIKTFMRSEYISTPLNMEKFLFVKERMLLGSVNKKDIISCRKFKKNISRNHQKSLFNSNKVHLNFIHLPETCKIKTNSKEEIVGITDVSLKSTYISELSTEKDLAKGQKPSKEHNTLTTPNSIVNLMKMWGEDKNSILYSSFLQKQKIALPSTSFTPRTESPVTNKRMLFTNDKRNSKNYSSLNDLLSNRHCIVEALCPTRNNFTSDTHECEISLIVYNADIRIWINNLLNHFQSVHNHAVASNTDGNESLEFLISEPNKKYAIITIMWPNRYSEQYNSDFNTHCENYVKKQQQNRYTPFLHHFLIYDFDAQLFTDLISQIDNNCKIFEHSNNWTKVKFFGPSFDETYFSVNRSNGLLSNLINSFWESQARLDENKTIMQPHEIEDRLYELFKFHSSECFYEKNNVTIMDEIIAPNHSKPLINPNEKTLSTTFDGTVITSSKKLHNADLLHPHLPSTSKDVSLIKNKIIKMPNKENKVLVKNCLKSIKPHKSKGAKKQTFEKESKYKHEKLYDTVKFRAKAKKLQKFNKFVKNQKLERNYLNTDKKSKTKSENNSVLLGKPFEISLSDNKNVKTKTEVTTFSEDTHKELTFQGTFSRLHPSASSTRLIVPSQNFASERKLEERFNYILYDFYSSLRKLLNPSNFLLTSRNLAALRTFRSAADTIPKKNCFSLINKHRNNLKEFNIYQNLLNLENMSYTKSIIIQGEDSKALQANSMEISLVPTKIVVEFSKSRENEEHNINLLENSMTKTFKSKILNEEIKKRGSKRRLECCVEGILPVKVSCYGSIANNKDNLAKQTSLLSENDKINNFVTENDESNNSVSLACHLYLEIKKLTKNLDIPNRIGEISSSSQYDGCGNSSQLLNMTSIRNNVEIILQDKIFYSNINTLPLSTHSKFTNNNPFAFEKYVKSCTLSDMDNEFKNSECKLTGRTNGVTTPITFIENNVVQEDNVISVPTCSSSALFSVDSFKLNTKTIPKLVERNDNGLNIVKVRAPVKIFSSHMFLNKQDELYSIAEPLTNTLSLPSTNFSHLKMLTVQLLQKNQHLNEISFGMNVRDFIKENGPLFREKCNTLNIELKTDNLNELSSEFQFFKPLSVLSEDILYPYLPLQDSSDTHLGSAVCKVGSSSKAGVTPCYLLQNEDLNEKPMQPIENLALPDLNPLGSTDPNKPPHYNEIHSNKVQTPNEPILERNEEQYCAKEVPRLTNNESLKNQKSSAVKETSSSAVTGSSVSENMTSDQISSSFLLQSRRIPETGLDNKTGEIFFDHDKISTIHNDVSKTKSNTEVDEYLADEEESLQNKSRTVTPEKKMPFSKIMVSERYISNPYKESVVKFTESDYDIYSPYSLKKDGSFLSSYNLKKRALESNYKCSILERKDFIKNSIEVSSTSNLKKIKRMNTLEINQDKSEKGRKSKNLKKKIDIFKSHINSKSNPYVRLKFIHISRIQEVMREFNLRKLTLPLGVCRMLSINEKAYAHTIISKKWISFYADAQIGSSQSTNKSSRKIEDITLGDSQHQKQPANLALNNKPVKAPSPLLTEDASVVRSTGTGKTKFNKGRIEIHSRGTNKEIETTSIVESKITNYIPMNMSKKTEILKNTENKKLKSQRKLQAETPKIILLGETFKRKQGRPPKKGVTSFENIVASTKIKKNLFKDEKVLADNTENNFELLTSECSSELQSNNVEISESTELIPNIDVSVEKSQEEPVTSSGLQSFEDDNEYEEQSRDEHFHQTIFSPASSSSAEITTIQDKYQISSESLNLIRTFFEEKSLKKQYEEPVSSSGIRSESFDEDNTVESSSEGSNYAVEDGNSVSSAKSREIEDQISMQSYNSMLNSTKFSENAGSTGTNYSKFKNNSPLPNEIPDESVCNETTSNNSSSLEGDDTNKTAKIHTEQPKIHFLSENSSFNKYYTASTSEKDSPSLLFTHSDIDSVSNFSFLSSSDEKSNLNEDMLEESSRNTSTLDLEDDFSCDPDFLSPLFDYSKMNLQYLSSIFEKETSQSSKEVGNKGNQSCSFQDFSRQFFNKENDILDTPSVSSAKITSETTDNTLDSKNKISEHRKRKPRNKKLRSAYSENRIKERKRQKRKISPVQTEPAPKKQIPLKFQEEVGQNRRKDESRVFNSGTQLKEYFSGFTEENENCTCATEDSQWHCGCLRSSHRKKKVLFKLIKQLLTPDDWTDKEKDKGSAENVSHVHSETFSSFSSVHRPFSDNSLARFPSSDCIEKEMDEESIIADGITSAVTDVLLTSSSPCEIVLGIPSTRSLHNVKDSYKKSLRTRKRQRKVSEIEHSDETVSEKKEDSFISSVTSRLVSSKEVGLVVSGSSETNRKPLATEGTTSTQACYDPADRNFYVICQGTQTEVPKRDLHNNVQSSGSLSFEQKSKKSKHETNIERFWRILREPSSSSSSSDESDSEDSRKKHKRKKRKLST